MKNREIKFRAWDKKKNKMIYDNEYSSAPNLMTWTGLVYKVGVLQDYIMLQYTGLKDKEGDEIYEGDIVERDGRELHLTIEYLGSGWYECYQPECGKLIWEENGICEHLKIIGNIYQNPELLKQ